jgi:hypothetical protein
MCTKSYLLHDAKQFKIHRWNKLSWPNSHSQINKKNIHSPDSDFSRFTKTWKVKVKNNDLEIETLPFKRVHNWHHEREKWVQANHKKPILQDLDPFTIHWSKIWSKPKWRKRESSIFEKGRIFSLEDKAEVRKWSEKRSG